MLHHHLGQVVNGHHKLLSGRETKTETETVMNVWPATLFQD